MKNILIKTSIFFIGFLLLDFLLGIFFLKNNTKDFVYEYNDNYLYDFKKNLNLKSYNYGNLSYELCTNNLGNRDICKKDTQTKKFDYVFIGDSFVEGLGIKFNDTFFGLLKNKFSDKKFLNLGVSGYSPSIYYNKLNYYYKTGYKFSEVFVFLDTSDIFDEIYRYKDDANNKILFNRTNDQINDLLDGKKRLIKDIYYKFPVTFLLLNLIAELLSNSSLLEKYYFDIMVNHSFGKWSYGQSDLYSDEIINKSLLKNSTYIEKIIKIADENNTKITFVLYPWPGHIYQKNIDNIYNSYWTNFFKKRNLHLINLNLQFFDYLKKNDPKEIIFNYYILGDVHFNAKGHKLIFKSIDKIISKN